ncbi:MAG: S24 family peptidase [Planctomycetes bacterium]|nr:S24 family peptidase [Planctomycetota bacterium]
MKFPNKKDLELAAMIGISPQAFANWGRNDGVMRLPNAETLYLGYKALGMLAENTPSPPGAPGSGIRNGEWPVRGMAAADDSHGSRVPDSDELGESIPYPPGLTLVPVQGDSMSPLVLPGQYVMIDKEREGFEANGGVVVVSIVDSDWERREKMSGTFVKRCFKGDGFYYFTSMNSSYSPFSSWSDHCRIWPVLGVWFGGKGKPPEKWRAQI